MRRLSLWMRAHPMFGDTMIAAVIGLVDVIFKSPLASSMSETLSSLAIGAMLLVPLIFRRLQPTVAAYVILAGGVLQLFTREVVRPGDLALAVALYTLVTYVGRRQGMAYATFLAVGTALWMAARLSLSVTFTISVVVGAATIFAFSWLLGEFVGARRAYHDAVEQRVKLLENERDQHARIAVAEERTRIARELHDVVAHAVSVIVVQADGAAYTIRDHPDLAQTAVRTIANTGREALTELRRLLDVLRNESDRQADRAPAPDVAALPELVEKVRAVGLPVRLTPTDDLAGLPAAVGLGIYRIVQEALTNTLKHAGPGTSAAVRVEQVDGRIEVEVIDDGRGTRGDLSGMSGGNGLIGMRERATVLGGQLEAGPRPSGGWQVIARFPVNSEITAPLP